MSTWTGQPSAALSTISRLNHELCSVQSQARGSTRTAQPCSSRSSFFCGRSLGQAHSCFLEVRKARDIVVKAVAYAENHVLDEDEDARYPDDEADAANASGNLVPPLGDTAGAALLLEDVRFLSSSALREYLHSRFSDFRLVTADVCLVSIF